MEAIYSNMTFNQLPTFFKLLIVIGSISTFIFTILLIVAISLMFESKVDNKIDLKEFDNFLNEFKNGTVKEEDDYPILPKIKDLQGNVLKNLLQIEIVGKTT